MVITCSFNLSKEGVSEVHFVTGHLFITHRYNKVLLAYLIYDGAVNEHYLKDHGQI